MAIDHAKKIHRFVNKTRGKLVAGGRPFNHLSSVINQCGWKKRSANNLNRIQSALEAAGVYPEPMLPARGLDWEEIIRYRLDRPTPYRLVNYEPRLGFKTEAAFEQFLIYNFERIPAFEGFKKPQGQYPLSRSGHSIDILCRRRSTDDYVVIELKKAKASDPVGQLLKYMHQVNRKLAKPDGVGVEGIIISPTRNTILEEALQGTIKDYPVQWLTFTVNLTLR